MADESSNNYLKQLTHGKRNIRVASKKKDTEGGSEGDAKSSSSKKSGDSILTRMIKGLGAMLPDTDSVSSTMQMPAKKTMFDVAMFGASCYVVYKYGKFLAQKVEDMCPTEKSIMEMMN